MYIVKIGDAYLNDDLTLSASQADATRFDSAADADSAVDKLKSLRIRRVKLTTRADAPSFDVDMDVDTI